MLRFTGVKLELLILSIILIPSLVFGLGVRVTWNKNLESDLAGYLVYCGTSPGSYDRIVGADLTASVDIMGVEAGRTYYFAVTARDTSGNQSGYSQQVSIAIPAETIQVPATIPAPAQTQAPIPAIPTPASAQTQVQPPAIPPPSQAQINDNKSGTTSTDNTGLIGTVFNRVEQLLREMLGLGPDDPLFSINNSNGSQAQPGDVAAASTMDMSKNGFSEKQLDDLEKRYRVQDVIFQVFIPFDLITIYPDGIYYFYPMHEGCPDIDGDIITADTPGRYLYMVFDDLGAVAHVLRISVADEIYQMQTYDPGQDLFLEDDITGVAIRIPVSATIESKPIAIGWGGCDLFSGSTQLAHGEKAVFFDILPYGLALDEQAVVTVPYMGTRPCVQLYDEKAGAWITIEDAAASGGYVTFSTQTLGRFKVTETDQLQQEEESKINPYNDRDDTCFVESARSPSDEGPWGAGILAAISFLLFFATFRLRVSRNKNNKGSGLAFCLF